MGIYAEISFIQQYILYNPKLQIIYNSKEIKVILK